MNQLLPYRRRRSATTSGQIETQGNSKGSDTLYIAVFGALWGLLEITLGTTLKGLRIPFTGLLMASLASIIFLTGRYLVQQRGAILMMGGVAALLKLFSIGGFMLGPFWAILFEALLGETVILVLRAGTTDAGRTFQQIRAGVFHGERLIT